MGRQPVRWTLVLDVSGSMSANFSGQCNRSRNGLPLPAKGYWQCANGPDGAPPIEVAGTGPDYYWDNVADRRITVAKNALEHLVSTLNLPGNPDYRADQPSDAVGVVWFNHESRAVDTAPYTSDPSAIIAAIRAAGNIFGDQYRTQGGSNIAAGLYRASLQLSAAPPTVVYEGQTFTYSSKVVLITDSVANFFLDKSATHLSGGPSDADTYPLGHVCRFSGVLENALCQTTQVGGLTTSIGGAPAGWDRPITQAGLVSREELQARGTEVFVAALSNIPVTGLMDSIASFPSRFFAAPELTVHASGKTNADNIMEVFSTKVDAGACRPVRAPSWATTISPEHMPDAGNGVPPPPAVGEVLLNSPVTGATYRFPITVSQESRALSYRLEGVPAGEYDLTSYVFYKGPDGKTRLYGRLQVGDVRQPNVRITVPEPGQAPGELSLVLTGDVCAR